MSHCRRFGKDLVLFVSEEDHKIPSKVKLPEPETQPGLILANGDINWNCPCLGGMATGPCGVQFRNAFSCFHYSNKEPKGVECFDLFKTMQSCMQKYPALYNKDIADDDELSTMAQAEKQSVESTQSSTFATSEPEILKPATAEPSESVQKEDSK